MSKQDGEQRFRVFHGGKSPQKGKTEYVETATGVATEKNMKEQEEKFERVFALFANKFEALKNTCVASIRDVLSIIDVFEKYSIGVSDLLQRIDNAEASRVPFKTFEIYYLGSDGQSLVHGKFTKSDVRENKVSWLEAYKKVLSEFLKMNVTSLDETIPALSRRDLDLITEFAHMSSELSKEAQTGKRVHETFFEYKMMYDKINNLFLLLNRQMSHLQTDLVQLEKRITHSDLKDVPQSLGDRGAFVSFAKNMQSLELPRFKASN